MGSIRKTGVYRTENVISKTRFCFECHSLFYMDHNDLDEYGEPKKKPIKKMMYTDIATDHEYSSANTAHNKCEKALEN